QRCPLPQYLIGCARQIVQGCGVEASELPAGVAMPAQRLERPASADELDPGPTLVALEAEERDQADLPRAADVRAAARGTVETLDLDHPDLPLALGSLAHSERRELLGPDVQSAHGPVFEHDARSQLLGLPARLRGRGAQLQVDRRGFFS